jgi:hypothetical protein
VSMVGTLLGAAVVFGFIAAQPSPCCGDLKPYASIYHEPLSRIDAVLTEGDGHAFAVIARDPLLQRPWVMRDPAELTYRAQRPVWGYLAWIGSVGQPQLTGWVLAVLTVLSCGGACAVAGVFLAQRGRSAWWALVVPVVGFETLTELTPELFSLSLVGAGILFWQRDRRAAAVLAFSVATLARETMLVAVAALACWELVHRFGSIRSRLLRIAPLAIPAVVYVAWIAILRLRLGNLPFDRSQNRLSLPGAGLLAGLEGTDRPGPILVWVAVGIVLCAAAIGWARHDVLAWIAVSFCLFGATLGSDVWVTNAGYQRALVPLYVCAAIALVGAVRSRVAPETSAVLDAGIASRSTSAVCARGSPSDTRDLQGIGQTARGSVVVRTRSNVAPRRGRSTSQWCRPSNEWCSTGES